MNCCHLVLENAVRLADPEERVLKFQSRGGKDQISHIVKDKPAGSGFGCSLDLSQL